MRQELIEKLAEIISSHACEIDGFFTDTKSAATEIVQYLEAQAPVVELKVA